MKTGNDWKTLVLKLYSFPKWEEMTAISFCDGGRILADCAVVVGSVQADGGGEGGDVVAIQGSPGLKVAVVEQIHQGSAVIEGAGGDVLNGRGDVNSAKRDATLDRKSVV